MNSVRLRLSVLGMLIAIGALVALAVSPSEATPPRGKYYAVILTLTEPDTGQLEVVPACLQFTKEEMCTELDDCGPWEFVEKAGHQNEWKASLDFVNAEGVPIHAELRGVTERAGFGNSIGGSVLYSIGDFQFNGGLAGTRASRALCLEFGLADDS